MDFFATSLLPKPQTLGLQPLSTVTPGQWVLLQHLEDPDTVLLLLRFGLSQGDTVEVLAQALGGPVILKKAELELALGREHAKRIWVQAVEPEAVV